MRATEHIAINLPLLIMQINGTMGRQMISGPQMFPGAHFPKCGPAKPLFIKLFLKTER